jgi:3-oxoacyl-[acyl-carrier-protein] synthase II
METGAQEVWITGIGLVSSLGEGCEDHWNRLAAGATATPVVDSATFAPYPVHPLIELDFSKQIPRRGDQRQMGPWQRLGTYAAGLALSDAGIAGVPELLDRTNMIVAAGAGERDQEVDTAVLEAIGTQDEPEVFLNRVLMDELRPTLFLAQLSNLLAGNISNVHKVTGSSRTFMGEEMAGVSAVEVAARRIRSGQAGLCLVGAAYSAEREDMLLFYEIGQTLWGRGFEPVWQRRASGGGAVTGSVGAFLVLESKDHAQARDAQPYARIAEVLSGRCSRAPGEARQSAEQQLGALGHGFAAGPLAVLSGTSGVEPVTSEELEFLDGLRERGFGVAVRATGTMLGHSYEAQFPAALALAALAVSKGAFYDPFDGSGIEKPHSGPVDRVLATTWGHWRGEGLGLVEAAR